MDFNCEQAPRKSTAGHRFVGRVWTGFSGAGEGVVGVSNFCLRQLFRVGWVQKFLHVAQQGSDGILLFLSASNEVAAKRPPSRLFSLNETLLLLSLPHQTVFSVPLMPIKGVDVRWMLARESFVLMSERWPFDGQAERAETVGSEMHSVRLYL